MMICVGFVVETPATAEAFAGMGDVSAVGVESVVVTGGQAVHVVGRAAADIEDAVARRRGKGFD